MDTANRSLTIEELLETVNKDIKSITDTEAKFQYNFLLNKFGPEIIEYKFRKKYNYKEIAAYDGGHFVSNAFRALLKREPSNEEYEKYLNLRKNNLSKAEIIRKLQDIPEGKKHKVRVDKLTFYYVLSLLLRIPLLGYLLKLLYSLLFFPVIQAKANERIQERLDNIEENLNIISKMINNSLD